MSDLTAKQQAFVREYLVDLNATQAAIRAGYSERTARSVGSENLTKPDIQAAIQTAMQERAERVQVDADYVIRRLYENVERAMQVEPVLDDEGKPTGEYRYEGSVANTALGLLGKHFRLFTDKVEHSGSINMTPDEATSRIVGLLTRAKQRRQKATA